MSVDRSKRVKNMFAPPKTADLVADASAAPAEGPIKEDGSIIHFELIEEKIVDTIKTEDLNIIQIVPEQSLTESVSDSPHVELSIEQNTKRKNKDKSTPSVAEKVITKKEKDAEASKAKGSTVFIGCRVSLEMKNALEGMAKDFAYLARKEYDLHIKDDSSSIQRAFLLLGMSCFTEKFRHKTLQEYDNESPMQDEVLQQLLALMRTHKIEIDDIDL